MNARELEQLESKIEAAKREKAAAEGAIGQIMEQLGALGLHSLEEAEAEVERLEGQITKRSAKLETLVEELRTEMNKAEA